MATEACGRSGSVSALPAGRHPQPAESRSDWGASRACSICYAPFAALVRATPFLPRAIGQREVAPNPRSKTVQLDAELWTLRSGTLAWMGSARPNRQTWHQSFPQPLAERAPATTLAGSESHAYWACGLHEK